MPYDAKTERLIALKKLAGKAQTSNDKGLANEALPSGITMASSTVFGNAVSPSPSNSALYTITGKVEYLRFSASFIAGSDTSNGRHGFELILPSDYEANSSNSKAGTYPFQNSQVINITSGSLQLIPPSFSTTYEVKPFYGGTSTKDSGTQIPVLDARDWYMDYFNGIMFQQDPSGTGDQSDNPDFVEAFLYIGDMLNTVVSSGGGTGGDPDAQYLVLQATGSLTAERVLNPSTGILSVDGGAGGNYTLSIDNSIVATLTGSQFTSNVGITGSLGVTAGISGSLTHLVDGTSYLIAGSNVTVTTGSSGAITVASTDTTYTAGDGLDLSGNIFSADLKSVGGLKIDSTELAIDDSVVATISGSTFTGVAKFNSGLSGSLTHLADGTSYIKEGSNVTITSASNGSITVASTDTTYTAGDGLDLSGTEFSADLKSSGGLKIESTELAIDDSVVATLTGSIFSGNVVAQSGLSGSIQMLDDGSTRYLIGTGSVNISTASSGQIVVSASEGRVYSAGTGLELSSDVFSIDNSVVATVSGSTFTGAVKFNAGLSGSLTHLVDGTSYIKAGSSVTVTSASNGSITVASTDTTYTAGDGLDLSGNIFSTDLKSTGGLKIDSTELAVDNSVVATLSGSQFSGNVGITGSLGATRGLSGSLTKLTDGTSYLIAGSNVTITSGSSGAVTIASTGGSGSPGGNNTEVQFNDAGTFAGDSSFVFNKTSNTLTVDNLSGSLTKISDGTSYLVAGSNVTISTGSSGAITISSSGTGGSGDANAEYVLTTATGSLSNAKVIEAGSGISLVTGSNSLTIVANASSINGRDKQSYIISGAIGADTSVPTIYSDFSDVLYNKNLIDVFLNGQLLHSGSAAEISSADKDYTVFTSGSVKFAFALMADDQLDVIFSKLNADGSGGDPGAQYLVLEATGSLTNERVFTTGTGLTGIDAGGGSPFTLSIDNSVVATLTGSQFSGNVGITGSLGASAGITGSLTQLFDGTPYLMAGSNITLSTGSSGAVTISSPDRSKVIYSVTSSHAANSNIDLLGVDFSVVSYLQNKIDIFVNGQLMNSGSTKDYYLPGAFTGSINFTFELFNDDTLSVLTY